MVLFPPPFYFVFDISNLLSYIQNNFSYELARPIMGTIFLVIIIIHIFMVGFHGNKIYQMKIKLYATSWYMVAMDFLTALNFFDFFNQYCSNLVHFKW